MIKGYKTLIVNSAVAALPVVDFAVNNGELVSAIAGPHAAVIISFIGLVNVILRWVTTTPVLKDE